MYGLIFVSGTLGVAAERTLHLPRVPGTSGTWYVSSVSQLLAEELAPLQHKQPARTLGGLDAWWLGKRFTVNAHRVA